MTLFYKHLLSPAWHSSVWRLVLIPFLEPTLQSFLYCQKQWENRVIKVYFLISYEMFHGFNMGCPWILNIHIDADKVQIFDSGKSYFRFCVKTRCGLRLKEKKNGHEINSYRSFFQNEGRRIKCEEKKRTINLATWRLAAILQDK